MRPSTLAIGMRLFSSKVAGVWAIAKLGRNSACKASPNTRPFLISSSSLLCLRFPGLDSRKTSMLGSVAGNSCDHKDLPIGAGSPKAARSCLHGSERRCGVPNADFADGNNTDRRHGASVHVF